MKDIIKNYKKEIDGKILNIKVDEEKGITLPNIGSNNNYQKGSLTQMVNAIIHHNKYKLR